MHSVHRVQVVNTFYGVVYDLLLTAELSELRDRDSGIGETGHAFDDDFR